MREERFGEGKFKRRLEKEIGRHIYKNEIRKKKDKKKGKLKDKNIK